MSRSARASARRQSAKGAALLHSDRDAATRCYREAVRLDPDLHEAWFDLGLIHKWSARWEEAFDCNLRAAELVGEVPEEPAWWNLGIAATALHRWDVARRAWQAYGLCLPDGTGPIEADCGFGAVRLNPHDEGEVVWGMRIDPARMRLTSVPFPASGHRWADVVLHDGAPSGYREIHDRRWPVFDELLLWAPSGVPTVEAAVSAESLADIDELLRFAGVDGHATEDWTRNVRLICKRCSEGVVHHEHDDAALASGREHLIGLAGRPEAISALVEAWEAASSGRRCHSLDVTN